MTPDRHAVEAFAAACARDEQNVLIRRGNAVEAAIRCVTGRPDMQFAYAMQARVSAKSSRRYDSDPYLFDSCVPWIWKAMTDSGPCRHYEGDDCDDDCAKCRHGAVDRTFAVVVKGGADGYFTSGEVFALLGYAGQEHTWVGWVGDMSVYVLGTWDEEDEA